MQANVLCCARPSGPVLTARCGLGRLPTPAAAAGSSAAARHWPARAAGSSGGSGGAIPAKVGLTPPVGGASSLSAPLTTQRCSSSSSTACRAVRRRLVRTAATSGNFYSAPRGPGSPGTSIGNNSQDGNSSDSSSSSSATSSSSGGKEEAGVEEEMEDVDAATAELPFVDENTKVGELDSVLKRIARGQINLTPRYQRHYIWKKEKACRLVESVMANLFVPAVVLHTNESDVDDVVDGKQRLTTLHSFQKGTFPDGSEFRLTAPDAPVQGLALLPQLIGLTYDDLPEDGPLSRHRFNSFSLSYTTFKKTTSQEAVLRVYSDLNCGAENLNKQQIRRAAYGGPYIDLLQELAQHKRLLEIRNAAAVDKNEEDQELILRFFAIWRKGPNVFSGKMDTYMDRELAGNRWLEQEGERERLRRTFVSTLEAVYEVYGPNAFRRWTGRGFEKDISKGLYDSIMFTFSQHDARMRQSVLRAADALRDDVKELCLLQDFTIKHFSAARLKSRMLAYQERLETVLRRQRESPAVAALLPSGKAQPVSRVFPTAKQLKMKLYDQQKKKCALCGNRMHSMEDAQLDHIIPFSRGGSSQEANAQLVHALCNRAKGARSGEELVQAGAGLPTQALVRVSVAEHGKP